MLMRLVQEKLEAKKYTCSAEKITHALAQALVLPTPSSDGMPQMWLNMGLDPQFHRPESPERKKPVSARMLWKIMGLSGTPTRSIERRLRLLSTKF